MNDGFHNRETSFNESTISLDRVETFPFYQERGQSGSTICIILYKEVGRTSTSIQDGKTAKKAVNYCYKVLFLKYFWGRGYASGILCKVSVI